MAVLTFVYMSFISGFSAQPLYNTALISTYNLFWTSLPIIAYALLEQDVSARTVLANPRLYQDTACLSSRGGGNAAVLLFMRGIAGWLLEATWHSLVVFFVPLLGLASVYEKHGRAVSLDGLGVAVFTAIILTVSRAAPLETLGGGEEGAWSKGLGSRV